MTDFIVIGLILLLVVMSIAYTRKRKEKGQSSCGYDCSSCGSSQRCASNKEK